MGIESEYHMILNFSGERLTHEHVIGLSVLGWLERGAGSYICEEDDASVQAGVR